MNMKRILCILKIIIALTISDQLNDHYKKYFSCYYNKYNSVDDSLARNEKREKFISDIVALSIKNRFNYFCNNIKLGQSNFDHASIVYNRECD